jgi:radical SAM family uncharacterized protein/radical SAM-linked protein
MQAAIETVLPLVEKPARYIGGETGAAPPPGAGDLRFVLCYPDVYEIGMSHKGFLGLYATLASVANVAPERCFAPWPDTAAELSRRGIPLAALESGLPLSQADVLGFSFASPLNFTAALMMLELAGVPLLAAERGEADPLVIAGGQAMFNAEPMAGFLDAVALGEGEETIVEIAQEARAARVEGLSRAEALRRLGGVDGVYIPSWYEPTYEEGRFAGLKRRPFAPARVRKRLLADAAGIPAPPAMVANIPPTHDRLVVEVMRGCVWGCRFCQAGMVTRPARERDAAACLGEALTMTRATGASALSFLALNACDYTPLEALIENVRAGRPDVKLSLPAARISSYRGEVSEALISHQRSQQTFAPEVGAERLRALINKDFGNDDVLGAMAAAGRAGCRNVKLYFMVGLPTETDDDAAAVGELIAACRRALREGLGCWGNISAAISVFVPQAHTPFQWLGLAPPDVLRRRIALAKRNAPRQVKVEGEVGARVLEACLARGDRRLGAVILEAYRRGARFDAWRDRYDEEAWKAAFAAAGLDMAAYACRELPLEAPLPWDHIDAGVGKDFLTAELKKALKGQYTPRCASEACRLCGACEDGATVSLATSSLPRLEPSPDADLTARRQRLRFTYGKAGAWRWLSHLELYRLFVAQLRRAGVPLSTSGGFSPRPRLVLAPALPVGVAAEREYGDAFLREETAPEDFVARVNREGPFAVRAAQELDPAAPSLAVVIRSARYKVEFAPMAEALNVRRDVIVDNVDARLEGADFKIPTRRGVKELSAALKITSWARENATLEFDLGAAAVGILFDVIAHLADVSPVEGRAARVTRTHVILDEPAEAGK